ncbi:MAG: hypothetical protein VYA67_26675 [Actinomycetota bacterium]|nr:hypothetical protein [Actinomycetota bacterium]
MSLRSLPNWELAKLLPGIHDFPADWNYWLRGSVRQTNPDNGAPPPAGGASVPASAYTPRECAQVPKIVELFGSPGDAAMVYVDRQTDEIARAAEISSDDPDPNAHLAIWKVPDGPAMIAKYVDWLARCGSYRITSVDAGSGNDTVRTVTTTIDGPPRGSGSAALAVTKSTTGTVRGASRLVIYHITYYWERDVLLEFATNLVGTDLDVVNHAAGQTLQRMRAQ